MLHTRCPKHPGHQSGLWPTSDKRPVLRTLISCLCIAAFVCPLFAAAQQQTSAVAAVPADEPRFDIFEFQVDGNTVLDAEIIERVVYPFLGERRSFQDVEKAQLALQQAYRDRGFGTVTVDLPEQRADTGVIRLQVWEGRIVRTRVTGSRYYSQGYILARVQIGRAHV